MWKGETDAVLLVHVFDFGSPSSIPGLSTIHMWALWWTRWQ